LTTTSTPHRHCSSSSIRKSLSRARRLRARHECTSRRPRLPGAGVLRNRAYVTAERDRFKPSSQGSLSAGDHTSSGGQMGSFVTTPFGIGTTGTYPFAQQPYLFGVGGAQLLPQGFQLLQIGAQQLQQVPLFQQHQLAQLQQIQQLIHSIPQQVQSLQQQPWQPFGGAISSPLGFGMSPQPFVGQATSHVM